MTGRERFERLRLGLEDARGLLSRPGNIFAASSWAGFVEADLELLTIQANLKSWQLGDEPRLRSMFGAGGDLWSIGEASGWGAEAKKLSWRFRYDLSNAVNSEERREATETAWTVVANVITSERGGRDPTCRYTGTPVFRAGAKVYFGQVFWGAAVDSHVIGRARNSRKFVNCVVGLDLLENVRPQLVYAPSTIRQLIDLDASILVDRESAQEMADCISRAIEWESMSTEDRQASTVDRTI